VYLASLSDGEGKFVVEFDCFLHSDHVRFARAGASFRCVSVDDWASLPDEVRRSAWIQPNGEESWPFEDAEDAITALAQLRSSSSGLTFIGSTGRS
jgi:hypothetical protein